LPRPDHRRLTPFYATVYAPLAGGMPNPDREVWRHRAGWYQQIDLARAYAAAERLPIEDVVVVDSEDCLGRVRRAVFLVTVVTMDYRVLDPLLIEDIPNGAFPQVPTERPHPLRRTIGVDLRARP